MEEEEISGQPEAEKVEEAVKADPIPGNVSAEVAPALNKPDPEEDSEEPDGA